MFFKLIRTAGILFFGAALGLIAFFIVATINPSHPSQPETTSAVNAEAEPLKDILQKPSKDLKGDAELRMRIVTLEAQVKDLAKIAAAKEKVNKPVETSSVGTPAISKAVADLQNNVRVLQSTVATLQKDLAKTKAQVASAPSKGPAMVAAAPSDTTLKDASIAAASPRSTSVPTAAVREVPLEVPQAVSRSTTKSDAQIKQELIRQSIAGYSGSCPCPITRIVEAEVVALVVPTVVLAEVPRFVMKVM